MSAVYLANGPLIRSERESADLIGEAYAAGAKVVAIPLARLPPEFFDLKTRLAGELLQKFVNYGFVVAIVGDVADAVAASKPLADFVRESNRGRHVWFVKDMAALERRAAGLAAD